MVPAFEAMKRAVRNQQKASTFSSEDLANEFYRNLAPVVRPYRNTAMTVRKPFNMMRGQIAVALLDYAVRGER